MRYIGDLMIGVMVVSAIIIGGGLFMVDLVEQYDVNINRSGEYFENTYGILNDTYSTTKSVTGKMENQTGEATLVQDSAVLFWGSAKILLSIPALFESIFFDSLVLMNIGIPSWFTNLVIFSVTITVTLMILSALFKWRFK